MALMLFGAFAALVLLLTAVVVGVVYSLPETEGE